MKTTENAQQAKLTFWNALQNKQKGIN